MGTKALAVLEFDAEGISEQESRVLTNRLRTHLVQFGVFNVLERGQMESILAELDFQETGCTSDECAVEVGQLLGVELMLAGTFGKLGETFTVDLRLIDVGSGSILRSALFDHRGTIDEMLGIGIGKVARDISNVTFAEDASDVTKPAGEAATSASPVTVLDFQPIEERYEIPRVLEVTAFARVDEVIAFMAGHFPSANAMANEAAAGEFWGGDGGSVTAISYDDYGIILLKNGAGGKSGTFLAASQEGFPIIPLSALEKTVEPFQTQAADLEEWYRRVALDLATKGFSKTLIILTNGYGGEVQYRVNMDNPATLEYDVRPLEKGDFSELAYDTIIRNVRHWVVTTYGDMAIKWHL
ncbi:MAG: hypothetical protein IH971_09010 [Candidatus Marinimicrobia bacterium]|nr:hypothetical protein [Candidatus Neomarinimicrobiota bacterium]